MRRHHVGTLLLVLVGTLGTGAVGAQTMRVLSPEPDQTVRESVPISVPMSSVPTRGYLVIHVDGKFLAAVTKPRTGSRITYLWNTKGKKEEERVPDGRHDIRVQAVGPDQTPYGNAETVSVFVRNSVTSAPRSAVLRYRFIPGNTQAYTTTVRVTQANVPQYAAWILTTREIDDILYDVNPAGEAALREVIDPTSSENIQGQLQTFYLAGRSRRFFMNSSGSARQSASARRRAQRLGIRPEEPALPFMQLSPTPRSVGSEWKYPMRLAPWYNHIESLQLAEADHKLVGFEWQSGRPTAKVQSKFDSTATTLVEGQEQRFLVKGERITYFDWRNGRVVRQEDNFTLDTVDTLSTPGASQPATPGGVTFNTPGATTGVDTMVSGTQLNVEVVTQMIR